jgi:DNA-directed RNA polymerase I, II, and III subunit RPABC1
MADPRERARIQATIGKAYRVLTTMVEMCTDRGYDVPESHSSVLQSIDEFKRHFVQGDTVVQWNDMMFSCRRQQDSDALQVYFIDKPMIIGEDIQATAQSARTAGINHVILVHSGKINPFAKKTKDLLASGRDGGTPFMVETFELDEVVVNITKHELVPKHEPLTEEEVADMLKAHSLQLSMLPRILSSDPLSRYFGMRRGQVLKITRKSETAGTYTTYRQVL